MIEFQTAGYQRRKGILPRRKPFPTLLKLQWQLKTVLGKCVVGLTWLGADLLVRQGWLWPWRPPSKVKPCSTPARAERGIFNLSVGLLRGSGILQGVLSDKKAEMRHLDSFALPQYAGFMHLGELDYKSCNKWKLSITLPRNPLDIIFLLFLFLMQKCRCRDG